MDICDDEGFISHEYLRIRPSITPVHHPGVMEHYTHLGSLYVCCGTDHLKALLAAFQSIQTSGLYWGVSLLPRRGLFVRALAHETPLLQDFFMKLWALFRKRVLGRALPPVRRY